MQEFLEFTLGGIAIGMIYAAIALSLVLIWRGTRVLNYSQGGMAMFTTYVAWVVISHTGNYWLGFVLALASGLVLGAILERTVVRPTEGKSPLNSVIVTIGLLIFLEGLAGIIYGGQYRSFPVAFSVKGLKLAAWRSGSPPATCSPRARCWPPRSPWRWCSGTPRSGCGCGPPRSDRTWHGCSGSGSGGC